MLVSPSGLRGDELVILTLPARTHQQTTVNLLDALR